MALLILAAVAGLLSFGVYRRLARAPGYPGAVRLLIGAVLAVGAVATVAALLMMRGVIDPNGIRLVGWIGMSWMATMFYLLLGIVITGLVCLVLRVVTRLTVDADRVAVSRRRRRGVMRAAVPVIIAASTAATLFGIVRANDVRTTAFDVTVDDLPMSFDGLRIAVISDIHAGPVRDATFTRKVVDLTNAAEPDLVLLAGDLADGVVDQVGDTLAPLADLDAPLGVYAATGNHEYISGEADAWIAAWKGFGIIPLLNDAATIERDGSAITLVGINDPYADGVMDTEAALAGTDPADTIIQIAHQPLVAESTAGRGVDLQVSGHTHGGQLWPLRYAVLLQQPMVDGSAVIGDTLVVTGRGAGSWGPPVRVLADPEIPIVTVTRS